MPCPQQLKRGFFRQIQQISIIFPLLFSLFITNANSRKLWCSFASQLDTPTKPQTQSKGKVHILIQLWGNFSVIISASSFLSAKKKSHYLIDIRYYKFLHGFFSEEKRKFHFVFLFFKIVVEAVRTVLFHIKLRCIQNASKTCVLLTTHLLFSYLILPSSLNLMFKK